MKKKFEPSDKPEGRYTNFEELTSGGMGILFKAYDTILDKPIAIKTLILDFKNESAVTRFQREAKVVSKLNHPNIVSILDFGLSKEEEPYMVMDFVVGRNLEDLIEEKGQFSGTEIVDTALQIARGLTHAHEKGIVHRDIKPSNILITDEAHEEQRVKIVDFGIAKISDTDSQAGYRTSGEVIKGSPLYISPEQVKGEKSDARSDIYSLGCVMYQMASGRPPFEYDTALATMKAHADETPVYPKIKDKNPVVASNLSRIIYKCLSKNPDDRFENMQELYDELSLVEVPYEETGQYTLDKVKSKSGNFVLRDLAKLIIVLVGVFAGGYLLCTQLVLVPEEEDFEVSEVDGEPFKPAQKLDPDKISMDKFDFYAEKGDWIAMNAYDVYDDDLKFFEKTKGARSIVLQGTKITNEGLKYLTNTGIKSLNLDNVSGIDNGAAKYLKQMKNLSGLNVAETKFGDAGLLELENPYICRLNFIECSNLTDKGLATIVKKWPNLVSIDITKTKVSTKGLEILGDLKNLQTISICYLDISDKAIEKIAKNRKVATMNVTGSEISFENLDKIADIPSLKILEVTEWILDTDWRKQVEIRRPELKVTKWNAVDDKKVPDAEDLTEYTDFLDPHEL